MTARVEFHSNLRGVQGDVDTMIRRNLEAAIRIWHLSLLRTLSGQRTGEVYRVPGTRAFYTASKAGEAPAVRTGILRRSYHTEINATRAEAFLGSILDYAYFLERGTPRMDPRPALQPSFEAVKSEIEQALSRGEA